MLYDGEAASEEISRGTVLPVVLVDELLRLHGIGVKLAESVFSSGDGGFHPIQAPVRDTRWCGDAPHTVQCP